MDDLERKNFGSFAAAVLVLLAMFSVSVVPGVAGSDRKRSSGSEGAVKTDGEATEATAVLIPCKGMIDDGLLESIKRRSEEAIENGADYLIYEIDTYGGLVISGHQISDYLVLDVNRRAHTVAYVTKKAISAGALISVACEDIVMRKGTIIGDCAPVTMGAELKGTEREKSESFIREIFSRSAEANGYPDALLVAMVTQGKEVYRVKNKQTGEKEFFLKENLPTDPNDWAIDKKKLIVSDKEILTLTAVEAEEYGIARTLADDVGEVLNFFENRDNVVFDEKPVVKDMLWSEQMVRWLNSPGVLGVLVLLAMLGAYIELNTPGLGLPGLVAVICVVIIIGSKFLVGLANWVEVAIFVIGIILLLVEFFVIPGFGIAGITGISFIVAGGFGMLLKNDPGELPWPSWETGGWDILLDRLVGVSLGFLGFLIAAIVFARFLPKISLFRHLMLEPTGTGGAGEASTPIRTSHPGVKTSKLSVDDLGIAVSTLRPAGQAQFEDSIVDVVTEGEFIKKGESVMIVAIYGNRVVVRSAK